MERRKLRGFMLQLPKKDDFRENHISNTWSVKTSVRLEEPPGYVREGKRIKLWMGLITKESRCTN